MKNDKLQQVVTKLIISYQRLAYDFKQTTLFTVNTQVKTDSYAHTNN